MPEIIELLADQLTNCVLWEPAMRAMIKDGISEFYEWPGALIKVADMGRQIKLLYIICFDII